MALPDSYVSSMNKEINTLPKIKENFELIKQSHIEKCKLELNSKEIWYVHDIPNMKIDINSIDILFYIDVHYFFGFDNDNIFNNMSYIGRHKYNNNKYIYVYLNIVENYKQEFQSGDIGFSKDPYIFLEKFVKNDCLRERCYTFLELKKEINFKRTPYVCHLCKNQSIYSCIQLNEFDYNLM